MAPNRLSRFLYNMKSKLLKLLFFIRLNKIIFKNAINIALLPSADFRKIDFKNNRWGKKVTDRTTRD